MAPTPSAHRAAIPTSCASCSAEAREARRYDKSLDVYTKSSIQTYTSLAVLNIGQGVIFTAAGVGSLIFLVGAPLVPLWGVWADRYSRKVVIVRSSLVMAGVLVVVAIYGRVLGTEDVSTGRL